MKKIISSVLIGLLGTSAMAQVTEDRNVTEFTKLEASGAANVKLTQGDVNAVKVTGDPGDIKNITTEVKDGRLIVKTQGNIEGDYKINVAYKMLDLVDVSGASRVSTENTMNGEKLEIITSGASK